MAWVAAVWRGKADLSKPAVRPWRAALQIAPCEFFGCRMVLDDFGRREAETQEIVVGHMPKCGEIGQGARHLFRAVMWPFLVTLQPFDRTCSLQPA
jgi:hypothetical protein